MLLSTLGCMYPFELVFLFFSDIYAKVELLGHMVVLILVFQETFILLSTVASPIYIPTNSVGGFPLYSLVVGYQWEDQYRGEEVGGTKY